MVDSAKKPPENRIHLFDPVGLITDSYASHVIRPARRATRSHDGGSPLRFAIEAKSTADGGESDSSSPRLWSTTAPKPPPSPDSRTQAIARGRRELMEMIKDMPESSYELSLRDIVDRKSLPAEDHKNPIKLANSAEDPKERPRKKMDKKMSRSRSVDNGGFLLKTSVFPMSFWLKTKKKKKKLAAKPPLHSPAKTKSDASSESESGGISSSNAASATSSRSSSASSHGKRSNRFLPDCFSFKVKKQT